MKNGPLRILLVEDIPSDADLIAYELRHAGVAHEVRCVTTKKEFLRALRTETPDAIISDFSLPQFNALDALHLLQAHHLDIPFILVTGSKSEEVAVECIKQGADDYILKSSLKRLPTALRGSVLRKRAERDRARAEERIRQQAMFLNKAQDAILAMELNGTITFWNTSCERLYGWSEAAIVGHENAANLCRPDFAPFQNAREETLLREEWHGELRQTNREGKELLVESRWSLIRDHSNQPKSILMINSDVTAQKKLEAHFFRAQRLESIGALAGGIAHDLNNVLTPILVSFKLLKEMNGHVPSEVLDTLETSAQRGASIVQQVLSFARGVDGEKVVLQLKHSLHEVLKMAKDVFPRSVEIHSNIPRDLWPVHGDPTQLYQVFMNLLVNARDAMPEGGRLHIEGRNVEIDENYARMQPDAKPGRYAVLSVIDTGTGISREILSDIFEPFFTTKEVGKGTGLGLSTAAGIVRAHAGFLTVHSEVGKGSTFRVHLPAAEAYGRTERPRGLNSAPRGEGELLLVVDDEAAIREILKVTLRNNGYQVITASDGTEAVAAMAAEKRKIDAVLVDLMMPFMDGVATIRALQKLNSHAKFLALSGLVDPGRISQLQEVAHAAFLAKPFTSEQILSTLHAVLHPEVKDAGGVAS